jgi:tyrosyl-tRNA synthetase
MSGSEFGDADLREAMLVRLKERLEQATVERRPLRVYAGYDPSAPDLHLGHAITLRRMRLFQELGHEVTIVIGTATAMIGDTSDRASGRPRKTASEVDEAAHTYAEQCFTILDPERTQVLANGEWLNRLSLVEILELASNFTVQQFLARDNYRQRVAKGEPVGLHEFFYALLQGYDAVHLHADVQLGATEQLFNILAGAKLQGALGQPPCVALTFPILVGTDGVDRMSKSRGNYIGLSESADQQFGKVMSVSDSTMLQWIPLVTDWSSDEVNAIGRGLSMGDLHPMDVKKRLARTIVEMYHGLPAAMEAQSKFEQIHQQGREPDAIEEIGLDLPLLLVDVLVTLGAGSSRSAARRLIEGGAVSIDGVKSTTTDSIISAASTITVGPRRYFRVVKA